MKDTIWDAEAVARETFQLLLNMVAWKNDRFELLNEGQSTKFKSYERKFILLFCIATIENCTLTELEKMLCENRSTISIAVSKLYDDDLISKNQPDRGDDGRKVYFKVTDKGSEQLKIYRQAFEQDIVKLLSTISDKSKKDYVDAISKLNKVFAEVTHKNNSTVAHTFRL